MRDRFTDAEWATVRTVPVVAFVFTALADKEISKKEVGAFVGELANAEDELHQEVAADLSSIEGGHLAEITRQLQTQRSTQVATWLDTTKTLLKDKLSADEYDSFLGSVLIQASRVARAEGGTFLRRKKVSDEEQETLLWLAGVLEIGPTRVADMLNELEGTRGRPPSPGATD